MEQKCNSIFFGCGLHCPVKTPENLRVVGVRAAVSQRWAICSLLEPHGGPSQQPLLGLPPLLFKVPVHRDF